MHFDLRTEFSLAALFRVNHDHLTTAGAQGLARHLRVPLPQVRHSGHARAAAVA